VAEPVIAGVGILADDGGGEVVVVAGEGLLGEGDADIAQVSARFQGRYYYRSLGRSPYLFHRAKDESSAAAPEPETVALHLVRLPFKGYRPNRYIWSNAVEGVTQLDDGGSSLFVAPTLDGFRLARAQRFYYWSPAIDGPAAPEPDTWQPFLVRVPFKPYRPNRYRWNTEQGLSVPPEGEHRRDFLIRLPFKRYAHNRYRFHVSPHDSVVIPEPPTHPPHPTRPKDRLEARYKYATGARTRYNFHHATDAGVVVAGFKAWWAEDVNLIVEDDGITR
jgi:hypothetical protein